MGKKVSILTDHSKSLIEHLSWRQSCVAVKPNRFFSGQLGGRRHHPGNEPEVYPVRGPDPASVQQRQQGVRPRVRPPVPGKRDHHGHRQVKT